MIPPTTLHPALCAAERRGLRGEAGWTSEQTQSCERTRSYQAFFLAVPESGLSRQPSSTARSRMPGFNFRIIASFLARVRRFNDRSCASAACRL